MLKLYKGKSSLICIILAIVKSYIKVKVKGFIYLLLSFLYANVINKKPFYITLKNTQKNSIILAFLNA